MRDYFIKNINSQINYIFHFRYLEETCNKDVQDIKKIDDVQTRVALIDGLKSFYIYHSDMFVMLRFLHSLTSGLPKQPLGRQLREIYSICLKQNITETEDFSQAFQLLRMMSRDDLIELLTKSLPVLKDVIEKSDNLKKVFSDVETFIHRLVHLNEEEEEKADLMKGRLSLLFNVVVFCVCKHTN